MTGNDRLRAALEVCDELGIEAESVGQWTTTSELFAIVHADDIPSVPGEVSRVWFEGTQMGELRSEFLGVVFRTGLIFLDHEEAE